MKGDAEAVPDEAQPSQQNQTKNAYEEAQKQRNTTSQLKRERRIKTSGQRNVSRRKMERANRHWILVSLLMFIT
jgi:hypothetical protein